MTDVERKRVVRLLVRERFFDGQHLDLLVVLTNERKSEVALRASSSSESNPAFTLEYRVQLAYSAA